MREHDEGRLAMKGALWGLLMATPIWAVGIWIAVWIMKDMIIWLTK